MLENTISVRITIPLAENRQYVSNAMESLIEDASELRDAIENIIRITARVGDYPSIANRYGGSQFALDRIGAQITGVKVGSLEIELQIIATAAGGLAVHLIWAAFTGFWNWVAKLKENNPSTPISPPFSDKDIVESLENMSELEEHYNRILRKSPDGRITIEEVHKRTWKP